MISVRYTLKGKITNRQKLSGKLNATIRNINPLTHEKTITPTKNIQEVTYDDGYTGLSKVTINAIPEEYIIPEGMLSITENATYDVTNYAKVTASVRPTPNLQDKSITINENGTQNIKADEEYDGLNQVEVTVEVEGKEDLTSELTEQNTLLDNQSITIDDIKKALQGKASVEISLQEKTITPTTSQQNVIADSSYDGLSKVVVNAVDSSIDGNIQASNIKKGIDILGVTGTLEEGIAPSGSLEITENGTYDVTNYASANVNVASSGGETPEYTKVGYIQFTEEQTIDTGIICNQNTKIKVVFTREKTSQHYLLGVASSDNTASVTAYLGGSWRFGNKSSTKTLTANEDMVYSGIIDSSQITITGNKTAISGVNDFETIGTLLLGACRNNDGTIGYSQFAGKIYSFEMWQGEEQVLKLIPAVNKDGVYGFLDSVSGNFFTSITDTQLEGEV